MQVRWLLGAAVSIAAGCAAYRSEPFWVSILAFQIVGPVAMLFLTAHRKKGVIGVFLGLLGGSVISLCLDRGDHDLWPIERGSSRWVCFR
jgi:hypothetical protein